MGLFSFVGGLIGGGKAKSASRKADAAQIDALNRLIGVQQQQYDQTRTDFAPYREGGGAAVMSLADLLGLNGADAQTAGLSGLRESPLYQSLYRNGEEATLANASATGVLRGGDTQRSLYNLGEDTYTRTLQNQLQQLAQMAGIGMGATGSTAQFGENNAGRVGQGIIQQGDNLAQSRLTRAGINSQMWGNLGGFLDDIGNKAMSGGNPMTGIIKGLFG